MKIFYCPNRKCWFDEHDADECEAGHHVVLPISKQDVCHLLNSINLAYSQLIDGRDHHCMETIREGYEDVAMQQITIIEED